MSYTFGDHGVLYQCGFKGLGGEYRMFTWWRDKNGEYVGIVRNCGESWGAQKLLESYVNWRAR